MAKKGGLGTGVSSLLQGSARQRRKQVERTDLEPESSTLAPEPASGFASTSDVAADTNSELTSKNASPKKVAALDAAVETDAGDHKEKPPQVDVSATTVNSTGNSANAESLAQLAMTEIRPGSYQPRRTFEKQALQELADSIKQQGMIQPILVRPYAGRFEIIAGERRWRAAELAGLKVIPAIIRDLDDRSVAAVALIENIQRKDLNPLEEATALKRLRDEFGMTQERVAESVGRSRAAVANILRLLDLHDDVKAMLEAGDINMGHARALLALETAEQPPLAEEVVKKELSVRATEALVRERIGRVDSKKKSDKSTKLRNDKRDPNIVTLERELGDKLGASVQIQQSDSGSGKLEISYNSLDELDGILQHIK